MLVVSLITLFAASQAAQTWDYDQEDMNTDDWADGWPECGYQRQSPIDVVWDEDATCTPLVLEWPADGGNLSRHFVIRNSGHSLVATPFDFNYNGGGDLSEFEILAHANDTGITLENNFWNTYESRVNHKYCFHSLHFHWGENSSDGSEHTYNGKFYPLEVHFVHFSCDYYLLGDAVGDYMSGDAAANSDDENVLAVIGVQFEIGDANPAIDAMLSDFLLEGITAPHNLGEFDENWIELYYTQFDMGDLVPDDMEYAAYLGSLTTPPCLETVRWHNVKQSLTVSEEQMEAFRKLLETDNANDTMSPNWRPVQPLYGRTIYNCQEDIDEEMVEKEEADSDSYSDGDYEESTQTWDYDQPDMNTDDWADGWAECGYNRQSPIDVIWDTDASCEPLVLEWPADGGNLSGHFAIRNSGHSLVATPFDFSYNGGGDLNGFEILHHANDTGITLENNFWNTYESRVNHKYCFHSLHFHWGVTSVNGSEHTYNGKYYPLEVHFVHFSCDYYLLGDALTDYISGAAERNYDDENVLAVIGVQFEIGEANPAIDKMLSDFLLEGITAPHNLGEFDANWIELYYTQFDMGDLIPDDMEYAAYLGSLTTPPCLETVRWHNIKQPMTVSEEQMEAFRSLLETDDPDDSMAPNFRPVLPLNGRTIYNCQEDIEADMVEKEAVEVDTDTEDPIYTEEEYSTQQDTAETWFIIGVVFICLFGVAVIVGAVYFGYKYCGDEKREFSRVSTTAN